MNREETRKRLIKLGIEPSRLEKTIWNLCEVNLSGVDLSEMDLCMTNLKLAHLDGAKLIGAKLICANLVCTNLEMADLDRADLDRANLNRTNLSGATGLRPEQLAQAENLELAILDTGLYEKAVSAGYKPEK